MPLRQRGRREGGIPIVSTRTVDLCDGRTARQEVVDSPAETRLEKGGGLFSNGSPIQSHDRHESSKATQCLSVYISPEACIMRRNRQNMLLKTQLKKYGQNYKR